MNLSQLATDVCRRQQASRSCQSALSTNFSHVDGLRRIYRSPEEIAAMEQAWEEAYEEGR